MGGRDGGGGGRGGEKRSREGRGGGGGGGGGRGQGGKQGGSKKARYSAVSGLAGVAGAARSRGHARARMRRAGARTMRPSLPTAAAAASPLLLPAACLQAKGSGHAVPLNRHGIFVTCDSGWEERTAEEVAGLIEEVRAHCCIAAR